LATTQTELARELGELLIALSTSMKPCERCGNLAEVGDGQTQALCHICRDSRRDGGLLCIVARIQDLLAIERSGAMRGRYFVLGRLLSPLDGIGPEKLPLAQLFSVLRDGVQEVLIATPPSVDGEATALLLARELADLGLRISRIASGIPHGGDLEFTDQVTLGRAINDRRAIEKGG
jgi:recombination protein RecR